MYPFFRILSTSCCTVSFSTRYTVNVYEDFDSAKVTSILFCTPWMRIAFPVRSGGFTVPGLFLRPRKFACMIVPLTRISVCEGNSTTQLPKCIRSVCVQKRTRRYGLVGDFGCSFPSISLVKRTWIGWVVRDEGHADISLVRHVKNGTWYVIWLRDKSLKMIERQTFVYSCY